MKAPKGQRQHPMGLVLLCLVMGLSACASRTAREIIDEKQGQSKARAAAYAAEGFTMDHRSPDPRPYRAWEFYYKHCTLVSRNPFPDRSEYSCTDPN